MYMNINIYIIYVEDLFDGHRQREGYDLSKKVDITNYRVEVVAR